eukprot:gene3008-8189_t
MEATSPIRGIAFGAIASSFAEIVTMPIDVVKVRLQMQGADGTQHYSGVFDAAQKTARREGLSALWKGIKPALLRQAHETIFNFFSCQIFFSLVGRVRRSERNRYGLYAPIRNAIGVGAGTPKKDIGFHHKFLAGALSGALAAFLANPTDLVKVRLQVDGMSSSPPRYHGMGHCLRAISKQEGILAFWKGSGPTMGRATVLAAVELSSYDEIKKQLIAYNLVQPRTISGVFVSSLMTGFVCALSSSPFDVVKSRVMGQPVDSSGRGVLYRGMLHCFVKTFQKEGIFAFYRGFFPNWARLAPRSVICFVVMEALNEWFRFI